MGWISRSSSLLLLLSLSSLSQASEVHTPHCLAGCPSGSPSTNDLIVRVNYTISSNDQTKFTDWAAYRVHQSMIGSGCKRKWRPDPELSSPETLEPADYKGAHATIGTDRGHQVPLASFCGTSTWYETNYLSNITPQKSDLNQGPWKYLEEDVRALAGKTQQSVYVLTGPLYEREMPSLPGADEPHRVPSGYWKVIAMKDKASITTASFIFDQETSRRTKYCSLSVSLKDVEARSKLDLFPSLTSDYSLIEGKLQRDLCAIRR